LKLKNLKLETSTLPLSDGRDLHIGICLGGVVHAFEAEAEQAEEAGLIAFEVAEFGKFSVFTSFQRASTSDCTAGAISQSSTRMRPVRHRAGGSIVKTIAEEAVHLLDGVLMVPSAFMTL
jgi:hypothetical protein